MTTKTHTFQVIGNRPFPIGMLRHDACYPASEQDSGLIDVTLGHMNEGFVTVTLRHRGEDRHYRPTDNRWASFGWTVVYNSLREVV